MMSLLEKDFKKLILKLWGNLRKITDKVNKICKKKKGTTKHRKFKNKPACNCGI